MVGRWCLHTCRGDMDRNNICLSTRVPYLTKPIPFLHSFSFVITCGCCMARFWPNIRLLSGLPVQQQNRHNVPIRQRLCGTEDFDCWNSDAPSNLPLRQRLCPGPFRAFRREPRRSKSLADRGHYPNRWKGQLGCSRHYKICYSARTVTRSSIFI